jgi:hypothetical protein
MALAILAYGSLKDDPGPELKLLICDQKRIRTPFRVEYGRASAKRAGAPTLIPMECGATVTATLLILDSTVTVEAARDMLWRREVGVTHGRYNPPNAPTANHVLIDEYKNLGGVDLVLSTRIGANIASPTPEDLARRAIISARSSEVEDGEDGISYLLRAKSSGVQTPLTASYERAILDQTGTNTLEEAIKLVRPPRVAVHRRIRRTRKCGT